MENFLRGLEIVPYVPGQGPTFRLELYDEYRTRRGKHVVSFDLVQVDSDGTERWIFEGQEFGCAGIYEIASDQSLKTALTFATLRPGPGGDDPECFDSYTDRQLEFAETHADQVAVAALDALGIED